MNLSSVSGVGMIVYPAVSSRGLVARALTGRDEQHPRRRGGSSRMPGIPGNDHERARLGEVNRLFRTAPVQNHRGLPDGFPSSTSLRRRRTTTPEYGP